MSKKLTEKLLGEARPPMGRLLNFSRIEQEITDAYNQYEEGYSANYPGKTGPLITQFDNWKEGCSVAFEQSMGPSLNELMMLARGVWQGYAIDDDFLVFYNCDAATLRKWATAFRTEARKLPQ